MPPLVVLRNSFWDMGNCKKMGISSFGNPVLIRSIGAKFAKMISSLQNKVQNLIKVVLSNV